MPKLKLYCYNTYPETRRAFFERLDKMQNLGVEIIMDYNTDDLSITYRDGGGEKFVPQSVLALAKMQGANKVYDDYYAGEGVSQKSISIIEDFLLDK